MCPAVLTAKRTSGVTVLTVSSSGKMRLFAASLIAARSQSSSSVTVNNRQEEACDEQPNVFLRKTRLQNNGREEEVQSFFGWRDLKGDDS